MAYGKKIHQKSPSPDSQTSMASRISAKVSSKVKSLVRTFESFVKKDQDEKHPSSTRPSVVPSKHPNGVPSVGDRGAGIRVPTQSEAEPSIPRQADVPTRAERPRTPTEGIVKARANMFSRLAHRHKAEAEKERRPHEKVPRSPLHSPGSPKGTRHLRKPLSGRNLRKVRKSLSFTNTRTAMKRKSREVLGNVKSLVRSYNKNESLPPLDTPAPAQGLDEVTPNNVHNYRGVQYQTDLSCIHPTMRDLARRKNETLEATPTPYPPRRAVPSATITTQAQHIDCPAPRVPRVTIACKGCQEVKAKVSIGRAEKSVVVKVEKKPLATERAQPLSTPITPANTERVQLRPAPMTCTTNDRFQPPPAPMKRSANERIQTPLNPMRLVTSERVQPVPASDPLWDAVKRTEEYIKKYRPRDHLRILTEDDPGFDDSSVEDHWSPKPIELNENGRLSEDDVDNAANLFRRLSEFSELHGTSIPAAIKPIVTSAVQSNTSSERYCLSRTSSYRVIPTLEELSSASSPSDPNALYVSKRKSAAESPAPDRITSISYDPTIGYAPEASIRDIVGWLNGYEEAQRLKEENAAMRVQLPVLGVAPTRIAHPQPGSLKEHQTLRRMLSAGAFDGPADDDDDESPKEEPYKMSEAMRTFVKGIRQCSEASSDSPYYFENLPGGF